MKKILFAVMLIGVGAIGYWLLSPLWRTEVVNEALPEVATEPVGDSSRDVEPVPSQSIAPREVYTGSFVGFDRLHQGKGTVKIIQIGDKQYLRFEDNFSVSNGPDLFVGFGKDGKYSAGSEVGALKGNVGAQNYELKNGFDKSQFNEVYVWCRAFSVPFTKAQLEVSK